MSRLTIPIAIVCIAFIIGTAMILWMKQKQKTKSKKYPKGHWMGFGLGMGIAIGMPLGFIIGMAIGKVAVGIALGPALGVGMGIGIGVALEAGFRQETRERILDERRIQKLLTGAGLILFILAILILVRKLLLWVHAS